VSGLFGGLGFGPGRHVSRGGPALDARPYSAWGVSDDWAVFLIDISVSNRAGGAVGHDVRTMHREVEPIIVPSWSRSLGGRDLQEIEERCGIGRYAWRAGGPDRRASARTLGGHR
jgi:hypothetical protein